MLYTQMKKLFANELLLTQMEKCAIMEALVLLSNQFKDYSKQKAFLEELLAPISAHWLSEEMRRYESYIFRTSLTFYHEYLDELCSDWLVYS